MPKLQRRQGRSARSILLSAPADPLAARGANMARLSSYPLAVAQPERMLSCSNCSNTVADREAKDAGWRYWSDGVGELLPFCPICAVREFSADAPASTDAGSDAGDKAARRV